MRACDSPIHCWRHEWEGIDSATAELNNAWTAASEEIYKAQSQAGGEQTGGQQPGGDGAGQQQQQTGNAGEDVQDVPYEEVK